jgi:hypothetical protein
MISCAAASTATESPGSYVAGQRFTGALENHEQCPPGVRLEATLRPTRINNLGMLRPRLDNREGRARGHALI